MILSYFIRYQFVNVILGNPPLTRKEAQKKYNEILKEKKDNPVIEPKIETKEATSNNFERVKLVICDGAGTSRPGNCMLFFEVYICFQLDINFFF